jgi:hypothetical protein
MVKKTKACDNKESQPKENCFPPHLLNTKPPPKLAYQQPDVLLENKIWVLHGFFSRQECISWIKYIESSPLEYVKQRGTRYLASRECYRMSIQHATMAWRLYERLKITTLLPYMPDNKRLVGCNPNLRLYKYEKGHSFGKHVDESCVLDSVRVTRLTVLIYLSQCEGGATRFEEDCVAFEPKIGSMLLHVHGENCLEHEADAVISGIKYVLRTDLVYASGSP